MDRVNFSYVDPHACPTSTYFFMIRKCPPLPLKAGKREDGEQVYAK